MKLMNGIILAAFLAFNTGVAIGPAWATDSASTLQQIMDGLRAQQKAVRNLRVTAVTHFSSLNKDRKGMHSIGSTGISAIYTRGGRFRMHVHSVSGGYNILAPAGLHLSRRFMAMDYAAAYNGRVGTFFIVRSGYVGKLSPPQTGQVNGGPPPVALNDLRWTGRSFSIWGLPQSLDWAAVPNRPAYQEEGLLDFLENPPPGAQISAKFIHAQAGHSKAVLTIIWLSKDIIELDPKLNFSVLRDKRYFVVRPPQKPNGRVHWESKPEYIFTAAGFWNPAPGVYYPKKIVDDLFVPRIQPAGPVTENVLIIKKVRVNDPGVGANTFVLHFPAGTQVTDESTGQVIHIASTPQQQMKAIGRDVRVVRKQIARSSAAWGDKK